MNDGHSMEEEKMSSAKRFSIKVVAEACHIDGLDHVNNSVYVNWCEEAAWAHSEFLGVGLAEFKKLDRAMAIRQAEYNYITATVLGDELLIETWLSQQSELAMQRYFKFIRVSDEKVVMEGLWRLVCLEISSGRPKRMPPLFKDAYC